jgi:hypothetical protein
MKSIFINALLLLLLMISLAGCVTTKEGPYGMPKPGGAEGLLSYESGAPMSGAEVYFYTDPDRRFRGPAEFMAEPTGDDGRYMVELPPGRYWAVARKRVSGSIAGSLQKGDFYSREAYGPIEVAAGVTTRVDLTLVEQTGNMLFNVFAGKGAGQGIRGVVTDRDGRPVARAYAFAYKDARMAGKPDYVSEWTREDGAYVIYVLEPGTYYVGARTGYMGVPRPDEPYGRYGAARDHSVVVIESQFVEGADIKLKRFSDFR